MVSITPLGTGDDSVCINFGELAAPLWGRSENIRGPSCGFVWPVLALQRCMSLAVHEFKVGR